MARVKNGTISRNRHKKVLKQAKGYFGSKHRLYRTANEQVMHSLKYAYRDRRQRRRNFRKLWITRINAASRAQGLSYSRFINGLKKAGITINRKMLSELAIAEPKIFLGLVKIAKDGLEGKTIVKSTPKKEVEVKKETVKKEIEVKKEVEITDYSTMTVAELKAEAKKQKITGYSTMKKAELIEALK